MNTSFDSCFIFVATRHPETLTWSLPEDDGELLKGIGLPRQVDDTFETILLMALEG